MQTSKLAFELLVLGMALGSIYALLGFAYSLVIRATRTLDFAFGGYVAVGAYAAILGSAWLQSFWLLLVFGAIASGTSGAILRLLFGVFERRKASATIVMLASLGVYIIIENSISAAFGPEAIALLPNSGATSVFGLSISTALIRNCFASVLLIGLTLTLFDYSFIGRQIEAVGEDPELARCAGVNVQRVKLCAVWLSAALAGCVGVFLAVDTNAVPSMGFRSLLYAFVACTVGGLGSMKGALVGGMLLGVVQSVGVLYISSQWQDTIAFGVMALALVLCPRGILGMPDFMQVD